MKGYLKKTVVQHISKVENLVYQIKDFGEIISDAIDC